MSMTDPISDMLTRVRNAIRVRATTVDVNASRFVHSVAEVLRREGYVEDIRKTEGADGRPRLRIYLKYDGDGNPVISSIGRISRPGRRDYRGVARIPKVLNGLGIAVLSTSRGVFSYQAKLAGKSLSLQVGFCNPVVREIPKGLTVEVPTPTLVVIKGHDKQLLGQFAAELRSERPPEPYKGKGVRYVGEVVVLKAGKSFVGGEK